MTNELREIVTKLIETFQPYADTYETHGLIAEATRALHKEPCSSAPKVLVGQGVLTMVLNALRRDAEAGREVRGEMAIELIKTIEYPDLKAALAAERERCAKVCENISDEYQEREGRKYPELKSDAQTGASDCEFAIRALGD